MLVQFLFGNGFKNRKPSGCMDQCHKIFKSHNKKGDKIMTNGRKTTYQEKIEIVSFCIANANDFNLTANKYN